MQTSLLILTLVYFLAFLNFLYELVLGIYVHFANMNLGHDDPFFRDISNKWHLVLTIVFGLFAFGSFKSYQSPKPQPWLKWLVFFAHSVVGFVCPLGDNDPYFFRGGMELNQDTN